jgi:cyclase
MSANTRIIARLDIKGADLIKGIHLEGLRKIGEPNQFALKYYEEGIDELILMDCVASLYGRNQILEIIENAVKDIFIPITVGGGIRSIDDVTKILRSGADKVAINSAAVLEPALLYEVARKFGSQALVLSVEALNISTSKWGVFINSGRDSADLDVIQWVRRAVDLGVGEILLTSIDREGTRKGFDLNLVMAVTSEIKVPVIASGGMGTVDDMVKVVKKGGASGVAMADILHYKRADLVDIRRLAINAGLGVRIYEQP